MYSRLGAVARLAAALLMATSVALVTAGLFVYTSPSALGDLRIGTPPPGIGDPILETPATMGGPTSPTRGTATASPPATSSPPPVASSSPSTTVSPSASATPSTSALPSPAPATLPPGGDGAVASRVVIPAFGIDLPILAGDVRVRGNRDNYPLCDVAQYLVYFVNPGQEGTVYIYAHAQRGMFLPLLRASQRNDGAEMIGALVEVYTADNRLHLYEIFRVKRHATDLALANNVAPGEHRLVLQTSEGTRGHVPKLQLAARPIAVLPAEPGEANPVAHPRPCWR